jgi:hypothetical protein
MSPSGNDCKELYGRTGGCERVKHGSLRLLQVGQSKYCFGLGFGASRCVAMDHIGGLLSRGQYGLSR